MKPKTHACIMAFNLAVMIAAGAMTWENRKYSTSIRAMLGVAPIERGMTEQEKARNVIDFKMPPMVVRMVIATPEQIKAASAHAVAFTSLRSEPCTIFVPSGDDVRLFRKEHQAYLLNQMDFVDSIVHELAHCVKGSWHD